MAYWFQFMFEKWIKWIPVGLLLAAFNSPLGAQAYDSAFEPLTVGKLSGKSYLNDSVSIEHATGFVSLHVPLGPGIGGRGLHYVPTLRKAWNPKNNPKALAIGNPSEWASYPPGLQYADWLWLGFVPVSSYGAHTGPWYQECVGDFFTRFSVWNDTVMQESCPTQGAPPIYTWWDFHADVPLPGGLDPGYVMVSPGAKTFTAVLPSGEVVTPQDIFSLNPGSAGQIALAANYGSLLEDFGYSSNDVAAWGAAQASDGYLVFTLKDSTGQDAAYRDSRLEGTVGGDGFYSHKIPARLLIVKGAVATEFTFVGRRLAPHYERRSDFTLYPEFKDPMSFTSMLGYVVTSQRNRFGDRIQFTHSPDGIGFTAEFLKGGNPVAGQKVSLSYVSNSGSVSLSAIPDVPNNMPTLMHANLGGVKLSLTYEGGSAGAYELNCHDVTGNARRDGDPSLLWSLKSDHLYEKRRMLEVDYIKQPATGFSVNIVEKTVTYSGVYPGVFQGTCNQSPEPLTLSLNAKVLDTISFSNGEQISFDYEPQFFFSGFFRTTPGGALIQDSLSYRPLAWGVKEVHQTDTVSGVTRTTKFERAYPYYHIEPYPLASGGNPPHWDDLQFWEVETRPDGQVTVRKFIPPPQDKSGASTDGPLIRMQAYLFSKNALYETRTYPSGSDWKSELNGPFSGGSLSRSAKWMLNLPGNPNGLVELGGTPYPTQTLNWNKETMVAELKQIASWDSAAESWKEDGVGYYTDVTSIDAFGLQIPSIGTTQGMTAFLDFENLSLSRKTVTTWLPLDGHGYPGLWSERKHFQDDAQRLPNETRQVDSKDGVVAWHQLTGQDGQWTKVEYVYNDQAGLPSSLVLKGSSGLLLGNGEVGIQSYQYDDALRLNRIQLMGVGYASSRVNDVSFGVPVSLTDPNGLTTRATWDGLGRMIGIQPPNGEESTTLTPSGDFRSVVVSRGAENGAHHFNAFGETIRETRTGPAGPSHRKSGFDVAGRKRWETGWISGEGDDNGWHVTEHYSPIAGAPGDVDTEPVPAWDETVTGHRCWTWGVDESGNQVCLEWRDVTNTIHHTAVPEGIQLIEGYSRWAYDGFGRVIQTANPNGEGTNISYTGRRKIVTTGWSLSKAGWRDPSDPSTKTTTVFESDALGRLAKITDAEGHVTEYSYDGADRCIRVIQWPGAVGTGTAQIRTWTYDGLGHLTSLTQPESGTTTYSHFDVNGNPWRVNYNGRILDRTFDALGRLRSVAAADVAQNFTYDDEEPGHGPSKGKLIKAIDGHVQRRLVYGESDGRLSNLNCTIDGIDFGQSFEYDRYGRMKSRTFPDLRKQATHYQDATGLPDAMTYNEGSVASLLYEAGSWNLGGLFLPSCGASTTFSYRRDQVSLATMNHSIPDMVDKNWKYTYDEAGRLLSDEEDHYRYDQLGRLKSAFVRDLDSATGKTNGSAQGLWQRFSYDAFGNRVGLGSLAVLNWPAGSVPPSENEALTTTTAKGQTYSFNPLDEALSGRNQLPRATSEGALTGKSYDSQGNLENIFRDLGNPATLLRMTYDSLGRVTSMTDSARSMVEFYTYDDQGLRVIVEIYQGFAAPQNLVKKQYRIYNEARQLVSEYELVQE